MSEDPRCEDGLQQSQRDSIRSVLARYPQIRSAVLYGSRAMGRYRPGSDIDLVVLGDIDLPLLNAVANALDDLLLPYSIDLSALNHIDNTALREHIERIGKVFYRAPDPSSSGSAVTALQNSVLSERSRYS